MKNKRNVLYLLVFLYIVNSWACSTNMTFDTIENEIEIDNVLSRAKPYHKDIVVKFFCRNKTEEEHAKFIIDKWMEKSNFLRSTFYELKSKKSLYLNAIHIDPNLPIPGEYHANYESMIFRSLESMEESFPEEFTHFFQNNVYHLGISQYKDYGNINIEFEAKFLLDYFGLDEGWGGLMRGAGEMYYSDYSTWIVNLVHAGEVYFNDVLAGYNGNSYFDFLYDFYAKGGYNGSIENIFPHLIDELFINLTFNDYEL